MAHAGGRPSKYSAKLADKICRRIANGESLRTICKDKDMPNASTVHAWVLDNEEFSKHYEAARKAQAALMFDELLHIADDNKKDSKVKTARDRLRVDTRKWYLSKLAPKIYGDKLDLSTLGEKIQGNTIIVKDFSDAAPADD